MAVIEYYYSVRSVYAYLGAARITALERPFAPTEIIRLSW